MKIRKTMTELNEKAISIKGKEYVLVKDRVLAFNEYYPNGCIITERLSQWDMQIWDMEIFKATVIPDVDKPERKFTWYSQAKRAEDKGKMDININAAMENAETSAVWRALAMMGIWVIDSIASADEMKKAWADKQGNDNTSQKESPNSDEKPRFNKENLDKFIPIAKQYKNADDALKEIRSYYKISKDNEWKIRKLYENLEVINEQ